MFATLTDSSEDEHGGALFPHSDVTSSAASDFDPRDDDRTDPLFAEYYELFLHEEGALFHLKSPASDESALPIFTNVLDKFIALQPKKAPKRPQLVEALKHQIDSYGGVDKCTFICIDVEAAVVSKSSVPLPLEISLVEGEDIDKQTYHVFTHPGTVTDKRTAYYLSLPLTQHSHLIPFHSAAMLRKDYGAVHQEMLDFMQKYQNVIIINKASAIDRNALAWVEAVAALEAGYDLDEAMPNPPPVHCITVLAECLGVTDYQTNKEEWAAARRISACWYHSSLEQIYECDGPHCASGDAHALRYEVEKVLHAYRSGPVASAMACGKDPQPATTAD